MAETDKTCYLVVDDSIFQLTSGNSIDFMVLLVSLDGRFYRNGYKFSGYSRHLL